MSNPLLESANHLTGALLNAIGIVAGGMLGAVRQKPLSPVQENLLQKLLGAFTTIYGLRLAWMSFSGPYAHVLKQFCILLVSLILGRLLGKLLRIQEFSNRLGQGAKKTMEEVAAGRRSPGDGFKVCTALFCAAPLGIVGAVQDGLSQYYAPLAVKSVMDGLAVMGFIGMFGSGVTLSALPVLALQGSIALLCALELKPFLEGHGLIEAVSGVSGVIIFSVALVLLKLKRVALADYLPALVVAPALAAVWR
jgi:uncharacterized membrane protein YqgA involved in biofilm formation